MYQKEESLQNGNSSLKINKGMNFTEHFLLHERQHFIKLAKLTEIIISKLEEKIRQKKNGVRSGTTFTIPIGKFYDLDIKFYKGYSRRTHAQRKEHAWGDTNVQAIYYPETTETNGTIEIYFNPAKSGEYYYKDKKFEDIIDGSLPKFIKDALRHEISHAYEDIVKNVSKYKENDYSVTNDYYNQDEELNANLSQFLNSELSVNADIMYKISEGDINGAVNAYIRKLKTSEFIKHVTPQNKIWIIKTIYTFVTGLVEQSKAKLPS